MTSPPAPRGRSRLNEPDQALANEAGRRFTGFVAESVLHRSPTSVLLSGAVWEEPAIAKILVSASPLWREAMAREIDAYRTFARHKPPFRTARLLDADERLPGLLLEHLDGERISASRYPSDEVPPRRLAAVLTAVTRVEDWRPPLAAWPRMLDYESRLDRYRRTGLLGAELHNHLTDLLDEAGEPTFFSHGDLAPPHVLRRLDDYKEGDYAFVDWAFAGLFLPGFDLAKLWAHLRATFGARSEIEALARARGETAWNAFRVNLAVVVLQELRGHVGDPDFEADWSRVLELLA
ncbi:MAG: hypothetical protein QOJ50_3943 [Cryptosporangiaceae bacterium]|nr:hypothetical protein [Cryptosporangiaceae bacterium]